MSYYGNMKKFNEVKLMKKQEINDLLNGLPYAKAKQLVKELFIRIDDIVSLTDTNIVYENNIFKANILNKQLTELSYDNIFLYKSRIKKQEKRRQEAIEKLKLVDTKEIKAAVTKLNKIENNQMTSQRTRGKNYVEDKIINFIQRKNEMIAFINFFTEQVNKLSVENRNVMYYTFFKKYQHGIIADKFSVSERTLSNIKMKAIIEFAENIQIASLLEGAFIMPSNKEVAN